MKNKKGINLIVLLITIIVMIIIAGTIVITLTNSNIIDQAKIAKNTNNQKVLQDAANISLNELLANSNSDVTKIALIDDKAITAKMKESGITDEQLKGYEVTYSAGKVDVIKSAEKKPTVQDTISNIVSQNLNNDGTTNLTKVKEELQNIEQVKGVEDRTRFNQVISYTINDKEYYITQNGEIKEGHKGILPQGEWNIPMTAAQGNGNVLNVKIEGRYITLNSEDVIISGFQGRSSCLLITDNVSNKYLDDGGAAQINQPLDGKIKCELKSGDTVTFGTKTISGTASASNPFTLRFSNNAASWTYMMAGMGGNVYYVKSPVTLTTNINYTGIYLSRFNNVKFDNYKIELSYRVNDEEIL